jgi:hypothetical protein
LIPFEGSFRVGALAGAVLLMTSGCIAPTDPVAIGGGGNQGGSTGDLHVAVSTSGTNVDANGYQLIFTESLTYPIDANGTLSLDDVPVGSYQVTLGDLAPNCAVSGSSATQSFSVVSDTTTNVTFAVVCS